jgi:hypothetical protein
MSCDSCNIPSDAIIYSGSNLLCIDVDRRESTTVAIQKAEQTLCELQTAVNILQQQVNALIPSTTTTTTIPTFRLFIKVKEAVAENILVQIRGYTSQDIYVGNPTSYALVLSNIPLGANVVVTLTVFAVGSANIQFGAGFNGAYTGYCGVTATYSGPAVNDIYLNVNAVGNQYVDC